MVVAVVVVVVVGASLPLVAWRLSRSAEKRWLPFAHGLGPPSDAVDGWLIEHYGLPAPQRQEIRGAVLFGRTVRDERLRGAAHELAGCVLRGELMLGRGLRTGAAVLVAEGVGGLALAAVIVVVLAASGRGADLAAGIVAGIVAAGFGARLLAQGLAAKRKMRDGATRAYELNA